MTRNYLKKFIKYSKKVYHIEESLKQLSDTRRNPTYTTGSAVLPVLFGFLMRIRSFNELKYRIRSILYVMSIAYNLMQLFIFKRLSGKEIKKLTQREIVRLLEKELYGMRFSRQYIFDNT